MRVAIVTDGTEDAGSTYWRALQHIPRLTERGLTIEVFMPTDVKPRFRGHLGRIAYFAEHIRHYIAQGAVLRRRLDSYDAVFIQRGAYPMGPSWVVRALDGFRGRVVLDLDDNVFALSPWFAQKGRVVRWLYGTHQAEYLLTRADAIVVSTPELARALPGKRADLILASVPDVSGYPTVQRRRGTPIQVGWIGNAGNLMYLDPLREVFEQLREEEVAELEVLSGSPWKGPSTHRYWQRSDEVEAISRYDVGIMPLPDTPYTRAKAGFKMLMYMGVGSAVIASPVGINTELITRSGAGMLSRSPEEWDAALRKLARDPALRESMGLAGRRFIREYADLESQADKLVRVLRGPV